jgi:predicted Zn-dependent protease
MPAIFALVLACFAALLLTPLEARAQGISFIRDAEIEGTIRSYMTPVFRAAGLEPSAVRVYLVKNNELNAFVTGGQNVFVNTGLLLRTENSSQVIGVLAHETGHIANGDLSRVQDAISGVSAQTIVGMVLGTAAAIAGGRPDLGAAILGGSQRMGLNSILHYTQTQEYSADLAAVRYLERAKMSAKGLLEFLQILGDQDLVAHSRQVDYARTHPLGRDRVDALQIQIKKALYSDAAIPQDFVNAHLRMKAKLTGFLNPFVTALRRYPETNKSLAGRYARAIAYYRRPDLNKALPLIDSLIAEEPQNPYFHELKGQMLFENSRAGEALGPFETAVHLAPTSALLRLGLASVLIELDAAKHDPALLNSAIVNLRAAIAKEPGSPFSWRQMAIAYGRNGDLPMSSLALAEEALLKRKKTDARFYAKRAEKGLPPNSSYRLQAQDILRAIEKLKK